MGRALTKPSHNKVKDGIQSILDRAVKNGVSDVHVEPGVNNIVVRYRRGGSLYVANKLPARAGLDLVKEFKALAGLDIKQVNAPQHGEAELDLADGKQFITLSTLPALDGEKITIHFLAQNFPQNLENMGLWGKSLISVKNALAEKHGLIIMASPQARTANDSLADLLRRLNLSGQKLAFINPGDTSLAKEITTLSGASNSTLLGRALRQDFNAIAISTVADQLSAQKIEAAARRQSKLLIRIPAGGAVQGLVFWHQLHGGLTTLRPVIIAQSNVRTLCPHCSEDYGPSVIEQLELDEVFHTNDSSTMQQLHQLEKAAKTDGLEEDEPLSSSTDAISRLWRAKPGGCAHCDHSGFDGDIGIFEVYRPSDKFTAALMSGKNQIELQAQAVQEGMISLKVDALVKALRGFIDFPTLMSLCGEY